MTKVRFLVKREIAGRLYCAGVETYLESHVMAEHLAQVGDVAIISRDIVLSPVSVLQTAGKTNE